MRNREIYIDREPKNLAAENSFRLAYENFSNQATQVNLFSLGSNNINQSIYTAPNSFFFIVDMSSCVNASGLFYVNTDFYIEFQYKGVNPTYQNTFFTMVFGFYAVGFNVNNMFFTPATQAYAWQIPNTGGATATIPPLSNMQFVDFPAQTLCNQWYVEAVDQANSIYKFVFPNVVVNRIRATDSFTSLPLFSNANVQTFNSSLNSTNPFVQVTTQTGVSIGEIQQSTNGSSIGILCLDIYSTNQDQIFESVGYQYKDVNGDLVSFSADPLINPYQPQQGSVWCLDFDMIQLNMETTVSYTILPNTTAYITYNYVRFTIWDYYEFNRVFAQQMRNNFMLQKKLLEKGRLNSFQIE